MSVSLSCALDPLMRAWRIDANVRKIQVEGHKDQTFTLAGCEDDEVWGTREPLVP